MRKLVYQRTEFDSKPETVENDLLTFVYDIPFFGACNNIFPPFHILNQIFLSGGGEGGIGPGAIWSPFHISKEEFDKLVTAILDQPLEKIKEKARYCEQRYGFAPEFDYIIDQLEWVKAVCRKYRK